MANNFYDEELKRHLQEYEPYKMKSIFQDPQFQLPEEIIKELTDRIPNPYEDVPQPGAPTPEIAAPEITTSEIPASEADGSTVPDLTFEAPDIGPSSFDIEKSASTATMDGRPESLPAVIPGDPTPEPKRLWELEEDAPPVSDDTPDSNVPVTDPVGSPDSQDSKAKEDAALLAAGIDNDKVRREEESAALERRRKLQIIPEVGAGLGDAISASASAFGGNAPGGSMERMVARHDEQLKTGKEDIETGLRNDAGSDISKQYQSLLAQMMQKDPNDTAILGLTANQITEKIPAVEKMMQRRSDEDLKRLTLQAAKSKGGADLSPAQKKFDEEMAKSTAEFATSGGIKVANMAVTQLGNSMNDLEALDPGFWSQLGSGGTSMMRGLMQPKYKAIEQEVRQNVTSLLRSTLGAQFTEKEGERIFSQTFDPTLDKEINMRRMALLKDKLSTIAQERARATDYFTKHQTFKGYQPQSNVNWTVQDDNDLAEITGPVSRTTKSNIKYNVSDT